MIVALAALAVVGIALIALGDRLGRRAFLVAAVPMACATFLTASRLSRVVSRSPVAEWIGWVGDLGLTVHLRLDGLAATMSLVVGGVGVLVLVYAARYFPPETSHLGRLASLLLLFGGAMLGLVQADNVLLLYTCWELTSITSYLLIGHEHTDARARAAALHALVITAAGGLAMLGGFVILALEAGSYRLSDIAQTPPAGAAATAAMVLVMIGAFTKSAQYPFHAWLPGAMAAPTPVSAYLHSAAMVKAGIFLVALLAPGFAVVGPWRPIVVVVGCSTLVFGGLRALRQHDLKLLLAFGTVSQLGLLMVLFGAGTPQLATAGWMMLVAHAAFKAALFMVVGILDRQTGTRDIRELPALTAGWRSFEIVTVLALVSMAGVPLGAGFVAKELAYGALLDAPFAGHHAVLVAVVAGSMLTAAYSARFYWGAFVGPRRRAAEAPDTAPPAPSPAFAAPPALLAAAGVLLGLMPGAADKLAAASLVGFGGATSVDFTLWHGFGVPLALSAVTLAGGAVLALPWVQPLLARGRGVPSAGKVYLAGLRAIGVVATRVTGFVQNGSLPVYAGVILATAAALPAAALLSGHDWPGWPAFGTLREAPVVAVLAVAAAGAAVVRRRFDAAVLLGVAGYAMAGLFVLSGAPDLALTQAAVETLFTVVFVLVLRRLPERFERQSTPRRRVVRLVVAGGVASAVFGFAVVAAGHRIGPPVSGEMLAKSVPEGHGSNVVNVILVDFRGFDTLGEITVLAAASIGAVALARVGRRAAEARGEHLLRRPSTVRRLAFVDIAVRVMFHAVVMTSLWLLFAGHNQPGGGFVGGLLAGSAITMRYIAGGIDEVRERSRFRPWTVLGVGLLIAATTAAIPLVLGGSVLEVGYAALHVPGFGTLNVSSALAFDVGVYLAVVGMVLMAFEAFGDEPAEEAT